MFSDNVLDRWRTFKESAIGKQAIRVARILIFLGIIGFLVAQLAGIGWTEVLRNLPVQPWFYVLFVLLYVSLPVAETLMYRVTWKYDVLRAFPAFIKKRIYNRDVVGYAGEVYFFGWAKDHAGVPKRKAAETIRDNNILSSVSSTLVSVGMLALFLSAGRLSLESLIGRPTMAWFVIAALVVAVLVLVWTRFRRFLFSMEWRHAGIIFGIQVARLVVGQMLQIGQWAVVMPEVSLDIWFTYAAISIILTRIPFLPNQQLIFTSLGIGLSGELGMAKAAVSGMLIMAAALDKLINAALFGLITLTGTDKVTASREA